MLYILKKNKFKLEEIIFVLLPIGIISGPLISEIIMNYVSIVFLYYIFKNKNFSIFEDKIIKLLFLFYLIIIISAIGSFFYSAYGQYSLIKNIFYFRFIIFGMAVFWLIKRNKNVIEIFYKVLVISYVLLFLGATYEFFFKINCSGYDQNGFYIIKENYFFCNEKLLIGNIIREDRLSSFFGDELVLGSYLSRLLPLLIFLHLVFEKKKNKEFFNSFYIIILTTFFTFWSGERVSFFFCLIILIIFFIFSKPPTHLKIMILSFCILTIGIFSIYNPISKERMFKQTFSQIYNTKTNEFMFFSLQHQSHAEAALDMFKKKPILGVGPKNFRNICFEQNYNNKFSCTTHPHNTYLQLLSEMGILGFIIPFCLLLVILKYFCINFYKSIFVKNFEINLSRIMLMSCFLITLFPLIPSGNFLTNHLNIIFYLPLGFYMYEFNRDKK